MQAVKEFWLGRKEHMHVSSEGWLAPSDDPIQYLLHGGPRLDIL